MNRLVNVRILVTVELMIKYRTFWKIIATKIVIVLPPLLERVKMNGTDYMILYTTPIKYYLFSGDQNPIYTTYLHIKENLV